MFKKTQWNKKQKEKIVKKKTVRKKLTPKSRLVKILDTWFSRFIRLRDSDLNWICYCVTCNNKLYWKQKWTHNCHYIERWNYKTRRDETNCHTGCTSCNTYHKEEHKRRYTIFMVEKYWLEYTKKLEETKLTILDISRDQLEEKIEYYKKLVKSHPIYICDNQRLSE